MNNPVGLYYGEQNSSVVVVKDDTAVNTTPQPSGDLSGREVEDWGDSLRNWMSEHSTALLVSALIVSLCLIGAGVPMMSIAGEYCTTWTAGLCMTTAGATGVFLSCGWLYATSSDDSQGPTNVAIKESSFHRQ